MPSPGHDELLAIWRTQHTPPVQLTPQQLREEAERFNSQTRRRYLRHQLSLGLLAAACVSAVLTFHPGVMTTLGCTLLLLWALYGMWGLHRFGSTLPIPDGTLGSECALVHVRQLKRQRDIVRSWPLGLGLAIPGFVLAAIGYPLGPRRLPWDICIALVGVFAFVYLAVIVYGKTLAARWQAEIDQTEALRALGTEN